MSSSDKLSWEHVAFCQVFFQRTAIDHQRGTSRKTGGGFTRRVWLLFDQLHSMAYKWSQRQNRYIFSCLHIYLPSLSLPSARWFLVSLSIPLTYSVSLTYFVCLNTKLTAYSYLSVVYMSRRIVFEIAWTFSNKPNWNFSISTHITF